MGELNGLEKCGKRVRWGALGQIRTADTRFRRTVDSIDIALTSRNVWQ